MQANARCGTCIFERGGKCHQSPPRVVTFLMVFTKTTWPTVQTDDWCGAWTLDHARKVND